MSPLSLLAFAFFVFVLSGFTVIALESGFETRKWVEGHPRLRHRPVFVVLLPYLGFLAPALAVYVLMVLFSAVMIAHDLLVFPDYAFARFPDMLAEVSGYLRHMAESGAARYLGGFAALVTPETWHDLFRLWVQGLTRQNFEIFDSLYWLKPKRLLEWALHWAIVGAVLGTAVHALNGLLGLLGLMFRRHVRQAM